MLDAVVMLARAYGQRDTVATPAGRVQGWNTTRHTALPSPTMGSTLAIPSATTVVKPTANIKRLSSAEITQRRKDGQCFHCDEFFTNGHKLVCKQLFTIEVLEEDDDHTPPTDAIDPTIPIHVLTGIKPHSRKMMQLHVDINGTRLLALLDSGSTHNFVDLDIADRAGIKLEGHSGLQVAVANGDRVHNPGCC
jgi:hypothetical protein